MAVNGSDYARSLTRELLQMADYHRETGSAMQDHFGEAERLNRDEWERPPREAVTLRGAMQRMAQAGVRFSRFTDDHWQYLMFLHPHAANVLDQVAALLDELIRANGDVLLASKVCHPKWGTDERQRLIGQILTAVYDHCCSIPTAELGHAAYEAGSLPYTGVAFTRANGAPRVRRLDLGQLAAVS